METQNQGNPLPTYHNNKGDRPDETPDEIIVHSEPAAIKEVG